MLSGFPIKLPCIATQGHEVPVGAKQKARRGVLGEIFIHLSLLLLVVYLNVPFVLVFFCFCSFVFLIVSFGNVQGHEVFALLPQAQQENKMRDRLLGGFRAFPMKLPCIATQGHENKNLGGAFWAVFFCMFF